MTLKEYFEKSQAAAGDTQPDETSDQLPLKKAVADPSAVHTAVVAQEVSETDQDGNAAEAVADDQETLVKVTEEIEAITDEQEGLSVESLLFATIIVDRACRRLGLPEDTLQLPAMESVQLDDRVQISTESLSSSVASVGKGLLSIFKNQVSSVLRAWSFVSTRITFRLSQIRKLKELADRTTGRPSDTSLEASFSRLHENGRVPTQIVPFTVRYLNAAKKLVSDFDHDAWESYKDFLKACDKIPLDDPAKFESDLNRLAASIRDPRSKLSAREITGPHPGGLVLFTNEKSRYRGKMAAARKLDDFATKNVPTRLGYQDSRSHGTRKGVIKPLSLNDIKTFCKEAEDTLMRIDRRKSTAYSFIDGLSSVVPSPAALLFALLPGGSSAFMPGLSAMAGKALVAAASHLNPAYSTRAVRKQYREEIKTVRQAHFTLRRMCYYVGVDAALSTLSVTGAMVPIIKASLRTYR